MHTGGHERAVTESQPIKCVNKSYFPPKFIIIIPHSYMERAMVSHPGLCVLTLSFSNSASSGVSKTTDDCTQNSKI